MSEQDIWTTCAACRCRIRVGDAIFISDRYSSQFGQVVCPKHVLTVNPRQRPFPTHLHERPLSQGTLRKLRPQDLGQDLDDPNLTRAPNAPARLTATAESDGSGVYLSWLAPSDMGSDRITGYVITRADPQLATQIIIDADTENSAPYYLDTSADLERSYTYSVAAINDFGTGAYSGLAYYPRWEVPSGIDTGVELYLCSSDDGYSILNGDGEYITVLAG